MTSTSASRASHRLRQRLWRGCGQVGVARSRTPHVRGSWEMVGLPAGFRVHDPALLVDEQGRVMVYGAEPRWGRFKRLMVGELAADFKSFKTPLRKAALTIQEAPFVFVRRNDAGDQVYYYMARVYDPKIKVDGLAYWMMATSNDTVSRPVRRRMRPWWQKDTAAHASVAHFLNRWLLFYHSGVENNPGGARRARRSTCVDEIAFDAQGVILDYPLTCRVGVK